MSDSFEFSAGDITVKVFPMKDYIAINLHHYRQEEDKTVIQNILFNTKDNFIITGDTSNFLLKHGRNDK